jgi:hypothetical protein
VAPLRNVLKQRPSLEAKHAVVWALASIGGEDALGELSGLLSDPDVYTSYLAAWGLGKAGDPRANKVLILVLKDSSKYNVRIDDGSGPCRTEPFAVVAARTLAGLGPKARDAIPALMEVEKDKTHRAHAEAAEALKKIKQTQESNEQE